MMNFINKKASNMELEGKTIVKLSGLYQKARPMTARKGVGESTPLLLLSPIPMGSIDEVKEKDADDQVLQQTSR